ncbi:monocarboxylate transporter 12-like isoform X2 [Ptychodera flava]|uniref:monocarboxylate transporter 12-like isoform X2 n=1 Tax=Ptychodera flava TaxID=63121 RepID=UPI00396A5E0D
MSTVPDTLTRTRSSWSGIGYGWLVVVAAFVTFTIAGGIFYSFGVLFVAFLDAFEASKADTALIGSVFGGIAIVASPISMALCNRFGHRKVVMVCGLSSSLSLILSSQTTNILQMTFTYGVWGSFSIWALPLPAMGIVAKYFQKGRLSIALGTALSGTGFGQFSLSFGLQVLIDHYGWRGTLIILAGISLNVCVAGALMRPLEESHDHGKNTEDCPDESTQGGRELDVIKVQEETSLIEEPKELENDDIVLENSGDDEHSVSNSHDSIPQKRTFSSLGKDCCRSTFQKVKDILAVMYDVSILRKIAFILILVSAFAHAASHYAVFTHVVKRARDFGIPSLKSSSLPAVTGLTQCLGRAFWGILGERFKKLLKPHLLYGFSMGVCGVASIVSIYITTYPGWLRDNLGDYVLGFYVIAVILIISCVLALLLPVVDKCQTKREQQKLANATNTALSETRSLRKDERDDRDKDEALQDC